MNLKEKYVVNSRIVDLDADLLLMKINYYWAIKHALVTCRFVKVYILSYDNWNGDYIKFLGNILRLVGLFVIKLILKTRLVW